MKVYAQLASVKLEEFEADLIRKMLSNNQIKYSAHLPRFNDGMWVEIHIKNNKHLKMSDYPVGVFSEAMIGTVN